MRCSTTCLHVEPNHKMTGAGFIFHHFLCPLPLHEHVVVTQIVRRRHKKELNRGNGGQVAASSGVILYTEREGALFHFSLSLRFSSTCKISMMIDPLDRCYPAPLPCHEIHPSCSPCAIWTLHDMHTQSQHLRCRKTKKNPQSCRAV